VSLELLGEAEMFHFTARSSSGDIRIFNRQADDMLELGSGGIPVDITTISGDIHVR
jgi:hypothetical protein